MLVNSNCKPQKLECCSEEFRRCRGPAKRPPVFRHFWYPQYDKCLEHHGVLEVGLPSLQVVHASIRETGAHFQGCTAVSESQLFWQPRKVSANWRDTPPKLDADLAEAVIGGSSLHLERLGGTIREQYSGLLSQAIVMHDIRPRLEQFNHVQRTFHSLLTTCKAFFDTVRCSKPSSSGVARGLHWDHLRKDH